MAVFREFRQHILPAVIRPLRVVWNQAIAFLFFVIAVLGGVMVYREYQKREELDAVLALVIGGIFVGLMAFYGFTSMWKARKISRS